MKGWRFYAGGFLLLAALDTAAHLFFKVAATELGPVAWDIAWFQRVVDVPALYVSVACYIATFFVWMTLLRRAPVGPAFAASHLELVGVLIVSVTIFHEHVSLLQWAGAGTILLGIACLAWSESAQ
ncbi:MAG: EamA family transporter, partial [Burkholderiaceae bacterium]